MATWYSDHFGADGDNDTSLPALAKIIDSGRSHGRKRVKRAFYKGLLLTTEVARMMKVKSGDRIYTAELSTDSGSTAGTCDIGFYLAGSNHDGAVVDVDRFGSAVDIGTAALDSSDVFDESTNLTAIDRGKYVWELLGLTADPQLEYEICLTGVASFTVADSTIVLIIEYVGAGD